MEDKFTIINSRDADRVVAHCQAIQARLEKEQVEEVVSDGGEPPPTDSSTTNNNETVSVETEVAASSRIVILELEKAPAEEEIFRNIEQLDRQNSSFSDGADKSLVQTLPAPQPDSLSLLVQERREENWKVMPGRLCPCNCGC